MRFLPPVTVVLLASSLLACSGNAVVEPGSQSSNRGKAFLAKCGTPDPPPDDGSGAKYKMVYACIPDLEECPAPTDKLVKTELSYVLSKVGECGALVSVYDVPCGPDLNAVECCYAVRVKNDSPVCEY